MVGAAQASRRFAVRRRAHLYSTGMSDGGDDVGARVHVVQDVRGVCRGCRRGLLRGPQGARRAIESYAGSKDPIVPTNGGQVVLRQPDAAVEGVGDGQLGRTARAKRSTPTAHQAPRHPATWTGCKPTAAPACTTWSRATGTRGRAGHRSGHSAMRPKRSARARSSGSSSPRTSSRPRRGRSSPRAGSRRSRRCRSRPGRP